MRTILQSAQEIFTTEQLADIQAAIDGKADVTIAPTLTQVHAMVDYQKSAAAAL